MSGKHSGTADSKVRRRFDEWKRKLVDLSRRNRLLFFRPSRRGSIQIATPAIEEIFERSYVHSNPWRFWAPEPHTDDETDTRKRPLADTSGISVAPAQRDDELATSVKDPAELMQVLKNLHRRSHTDFEERGVRTLYLAIGMLSWREMGIEETVQSPLLLIPLELSRESAHDPFELRVAEEEVTLNPALDVKLRTDFRIELPAPPEDPNDGELLAYLDAVGNKVRSLGWSVSQEVWVGLFSFHKLVIYRDLSANGDRILENPIVRGLAGDSLSTSTSGGDDVTALELDRSLNPADSFLVVDADSSQLTCIEQVKRGASLVLHGPPGTGKSQTITNVIAESLAAGKTVLFVSEKMAALEVVFERLKRVHLDHFCLKLHSHTANKRVMVQELYDCLEQTLQPNRGLTAQEVETLVRRRQQLCDYVHALHVVRHPLESAVFDVLAELAGLHHVPLISFQCKIIGSLSPAVLTQSDEAAQRLQTVWHVALEGESFPWRGCVERSYTAAVRATYLQLLSSCHDSLAQLEAAATAAAEAVGVAPVVSLGDCTWLVETLRLLAVSPGPDSAWLTTSDLDPLTQEARLEAQAIQDLRREYDGLLNKISELKEKICQKRGEGFIEVRPDLAEAIRAAHETVKDALRGGELDEVALLEKRTELATWTAQLAARAAEWRADGEVMVQAFELPTEELTVTRLRQLLRLVELCSSEDKPDRAWLDPSAHRELTDRLPGLRTGYEEYRQKRDALLTTYTEAILDLDLNWLVQAFAGRYSKWYRFACPGFYRTRRAVGSCTHDGRLPRDVHRGLVLAKEVKRRKAGLDARAAETESLLGAYYRGYDTDFNQIARALKVAGEAMTLAGHIPLPDALRDQVALGGTISTDARTAAARLRPSLLEMLEVDRAFVHLLPLASLPPSGRVLEETALPVVETWACVVAAKSREFRGVIEEAAGVSSTGLPQTVGELLQELAVVREIRTLEVQLGAVAEALRSRIEKLRTEYQGKFSSWEEVLAGLAWVDLVHRHFGTRPITELFVRIATERPGDLPDSSHLADLIQGAGTELNNLEARFEEPPILDSSPLHEGSLVRILERLSEMDKRVEELWDWVELQTVKDGLSKLGLGDLFTRFRESPPQADVLIQSIRRSVLQKWLGHIFEQDPSLSSFRGQNHEKLVAEFRALDRRHWQVGSHRVIAAANKHRPHVEYIPRDSEVRLLKNEALKQRRHLPIRQLFSRMPELITSLKPCLLMSPISVSQFLGPDSHFDLVIFDEASQICTEDAVGTIYRSAQLLVCGDNKQLPPSDFYAVSMGDDDFDESEDEETDGDTLPALQSVLDECLTLGMPEGWLRWHYRSKHESLIAFSNHQFYGNLVTFPSALTEHEDLGVKFIHVPDGVYDRGGKRNNPREAEVVADLVFEHYRQHQLGKSLGVVAFSRAQMETIDDEIERRKKAHPEMDRYFAKDLPEPFFVKNLENVQGDQRDIMIFSIGYGPDLAGRMTMGFGPLNKPGGERRLNVAITRATEKVVVVSSVRAADIATTESSKAGVRMLNRYLDYAERGIEALALSTESQGEIESPLELEVAQEILAAGYEFVPQVGCSGFRIDLGVIDPTRPGEFILGVECDGASYHSSYVARDKDRLRQEILERLGWRIHRIWSPDWVNRRVSEVERLRASISAAAVAKKQAALPILPVPAVIDKDEKSHPKVRTNHIDIELSSPINLSWTDEYWVSHPRAKGAKDPNFHNPYHRTEQVRLIEKVVKDEGPIHEDLVARRLAQAWGLQRVGNRMEVTIQEAIRRASHEGKVTRNGHFLWPSDPQFRLIVRVPSSDDPETQRKIEHITPEEIGLAMTYIVKAGVGITRDALVTETARIFGFERTGNQIRDSLNAIVQQHLISGALEQRGEHIHVNNQTC